jgi:hypothetical protein
VIIDKECLAKFGYRTIMKEKKSPFIFWLPAEPVLEIWRFRFYFFPPFEIWKIRAINP